MAPSDDVFKEFDDLLGTLPDPPEDRPMRALTELPYYEQKKLEQKKSNETSKEVSAPKNIAVDNYSSTATLTTEETEKKVFSNKKKFTDGDILSFSEVFSCRNQDTQNLDKQMVRLYASDFNRLNTISKSMTAKTSIADIVHNIINIYLEQNKESVKEIMLKNFSF